MKSVYALIPAALLAGTILTAPAHARIEDPDIHAQRVSAQKEHFKKQAEARMPGKMIKSSYRKRHFAAKTKIRRSSETLTAESREPKIRRSGNKLAIVAEAKPAKAARFRHARVALGKASKTRRAIAAVEAAKTSPKIPPAARSAKLVPDEKRSLIGPAVKVDGATEVRITQIIREMAPSYGVPTWFALRIADVESGFNPNARGRAGEIGIYQIKCQTARGIGFAGSCSELADARTNVRWGLKHLSLAIASSEGNLRLAASKHNGGLGRKSLVASYIAKVF
jgi:soluble lytic murein transglycosylase-like protein